MVSDKERLVRRIFPENFTDRERAIFEAGVAMGSILHTMAGIPFAYKPNLKRSLEKAMEKVFLLQPHRRKVRIRLRRGRRHRHPYDYQTLSPEDIEATVVTAYGGYSVEARVRYIPELRYPLAYISKIKRL